MPLISILMPVKNAESFLSECIESILKQSESDWELIAVNDHSEDRSLEILLEFGQADSRIKIINQEETGIISALNNAFNASVGQYIHRMDADDLMAENKLEELLRICRQAGEGYLATGLVKYFAANGLNEGYLKYENWLNGLCKSNSHWSDLYKECVIASPCWMLHRNDLIKCEAFQPKRYPEDYDLVFRFYQYGLKVIASEQVLHYWRDHKERTSRNDERYSSPTFFELKLHYFFLLDRKPERPLIIWGAGAKGKQLAKFLQQRNEEFRWVSNNPNKHGQNIYDEILASYKEILLSDSPQIIITVAQKNAKAEIIDFLDEINLKESLDYYFF